MKFSLGFFILFSCGCFMHSQDLSISKIVQVGDVAIIESPENEPDQTQKIDSPSSVSIIKDRKKTKQKKTFKLKDHTQLNLEISRRNFPEKTTKPKIVYKKSINNTFFLNSSGKETSAVLSVNTHSDLKKDFDNDIKYIVLSQDYLIKKNTYYYLFSKDTGKLYQFFNKPPPTASFS